MHYFFVVIVSYLLTTKGRSSKDFPHISGLITLRNILYFVVLLFEEQFRILKKTVITGRETGADTKREIC